MDSSKTLTTNELYRLLVAENQKQTKEISQQISSLSSKLSKCNKKVEKLESRYLNLERSKRKNNIIIFGSQINDNLLDETLNLINSKLDLNVTISQINNIYQIGKQPEKKGIVIEFISFLTKKLVFQNVKKLKGTGIAIANDLIAEDRENQKILLKHLRLKREENIEAKIKGNSLVIGDKHYSVHELENQGTPNILETNSDVLTTSEEESTKEDSAVETSNSVKKRKRPKNKKSPIGARVLRKK